MGPIKKEEKSGMDERRWTEDDDLKEWVIIDWETDGKRLICIGDDKGGPKGMIEKD